MGLLQPIDNFELSGAALFAITAFGAQPGMMLFFSIQQACRVRILVYERIIVELKNSRHIDPFRTWHAGTA